jgi:hypothetical protein
MYAFMPLKKLCLVYEDFNLATGYEYYWFIKTGGVVEGFQPLDMNFTGL